MIGKIIPVASQFQFKTLPINIVYERGPSNEFHTSYSQEDLR